MIVFFKMDYNQITMFAILKRESPSPPFTTDKIGKRSPLIIIGPDCHINMTSGALPNNKIASLQFYFSFLIGRFELRFENMT